MEKKKIKNFIYIYIYIYTTIYISILLFKRLPIWDPHFFYSKIPHTPLCLSGDKTKGQFDKNIILTPTKTLPTKYGRFLLIFKLLYPCIN